MSSSRIVAVPRPFQRTPWEFVQPIATSAKNHRTHCVVMTDGRRIARHERQVKVHDFGSPTA